MTTELRRGVDEAAEALFRMKLDTSDITFRLVSAGDPELNWRLAETMNFNITDRDRVLTKQDGAPLERCLFERVYERDFNTLERGVAWYLDDADAVAWWHRLVAKQDYHLQGWQREKVYPDFLACITSNEERLTFSVLEIKGAHLGGNDDTAYKEHLFDILMRYYDQALEAGEIELETGENQRMVFKIIFESTWRSELGRLTADPAGAR